MKVVINTCFGGFGLSKKALERYSVLKYGENFVNYEGGLYYIKHADGGTYDIEIARDDPLLVQVVEQLGERAWGEYSKLTVKEIPDGSDWEIAEYGGRERLRKPCTYY